MQNATEKNACAVPFVMQNVTEENKEFVPMIMEFAREKNKDVVPMIMINLSNSSRFADCVQEFMHTERKLYDNDCVVARILITSARKARDKGVSLEGVFRDMVNRFF